MIDMIIINLAPADDGEYGERIAFSEGSVEPGGCREGRAVPQHNDLGFELIGRKNLPVPFQSIGDLR